MQESKLFDFNNNIDISQWRIVNDFVMGGISKSEFLVDQNNGVFRGSVSLENNGGFAMVKYTFPKINIADFSKIKISLKGDTKNYQVRIKENSTQKHSYIHPFKATNEWQDIEFILQDFIPMYRGRKMELTNFQENSISEIVFLIGNKKSEDFELRLNKIELL